MNKKYILKSSEQIGELIGLRKSVGSKYYVFYYRINEVDNARIVVSVSKKYGNAVKRNYEKRVTKEILRDTIPTLKNVDLLIVIKKELKNLNFLEKKEQLKYLIQKLKKIIGDKND